MSKYHEIPVGHLVNLLSVFSDVAFYMLSKSKNVFTRLEYIGSPPLKVEIK